MKSPKALFTLDPEDGSNVNKLIEVVKNQEKLINQIPVCVLPNRLQLYRNVGDFTTYIENSLCLSLSQ